MPETPEALSDEQQKKLEKLERKTEKKLGKCNRKLQKVARHAERKRAKWTRRAARIRRKAQRKRAMIMGIPLVEPIRRDLPALENRRMELGQAEATAKAAAKAARLASESREEKATVLPDAAEVALYALFEAHSFSQLEAKLRQAKTREEKAFYRSLLNLKLQIDQEKVVGEVLL